MTEQTRNVVILVAIGVLVLVALPLLWGGMMMGGMMGPWMMGGWGGWGVGANPWLGVVTMIFWVLILAGIGLVVVWALRHVGPRETTGSGPRALDILKERYARGELTREQYEQMRRDLE